MHSIFGYWRALQHYSGNSPMRAHQARAHARVKLMCALVIWSTLSSTSLDVGVAHK